MSETAAPANGAPRNTQGQFSPKAGATGVAQDATTAPTTGATTATDAPPSGPQSPEDWKFEGEYDGRDGSKKKVQWKSKQEAIRAAQELDWLRGRHDSIAQAEKKWAQFESLSPEEKAQLLGYDAKEAARREVIRAAQMVDLTPEQRELVELREWKAQQADREQVERQRQAEQAAKAARAQLRKVAVAGLERGLELSGLPKTHHTMALLAEIQQECADQRLPPLPPELLAQEANRRYSERGVEPLKKLQGKALLERLGSDVVRAVLMAERERRGLAAAQPRQSATIERENPPSESVNVYGEAEAEARLRALRNQR